MRAMRTRSATMLQCDAVAGGVGKVLLVLLWMGVVFFSGACRLGCVQRKVMKYRSEKFVVRVSAERPGAERSL